MSISNTTREKSQPRDSVSKRVMLSVAESTEQDIIDLPVLYEALDPEALDALVRSAQRNNTSLSIQFSYAGKEITIDQDENILV